MRLSVLTVGILYGPVCYPLIFFHNILRNTMERLFRWAARSSVARLVWRAPLWFVVALVLAASVGASSLVGSLVSGEVSERAPCGPLSNNGPQFSNLRNS